MTDTLQFPADADIETSLEAVEPALEQAAAAAALPQAFIDLGLAEELVRAVADLGFTQPTLVQQAAVPKAMQGGHSEGFTDLMVETDANPWASLTSAGGVA